MLVRLQAVVRGAVGDKISCGELAISAQEFGFYPVASGEDRGL